MKNYAIVVLACACGLNVGLAADRTCTLSGVVVSKDGTPVPRADVIAYAVRGFRGATYKQGRAGADGKFELSSLPCAKYQVMAMASAGSFDRAHPVQVDISKEQSVRIVLPNVDPLASRLSGGGVAAARAAETENPEITKLRREYFNQLNPAQVAEFDRASPDEQKRMYTQTFGVALGKLTSPGMDEMIAGGTEQLKGSKRGRFRGALEPPTDAPARSSRDTYLQAAARMNKTAAAAIIRSTLSADDEAAFLRVSEIEQSAYFFRAVSALPASPNVCSRFAIYALDLEEVMPNVGMVSSQWILLGSPEQSQAELASMEKLAKCQLFGNLKQGLLRIALSVIRDGSDQNIAAISQKMGVTVTGPRFAVEQMFGPESAMKYDTLPTVDDKMQLYKAALLMQICWGAATVSL